ncbi:DMT family transporter [Sphingomonas colocasiae]|uniref:DMT family transporter n=1 Tax=Sphingomonas colocasiae TaxID=1848973 RepID=A0ABS7PIV1_9SPHN|nr:DMT family transporter [Sphingomonas colocasiae]MBY8821227.1 DMT family transporter [Sphingomonas colocasiae]
MTDNRDMTAGIACGAGAGALWGLVFLAPELVRGFGPLHLAAGRYLAYGLFAMILLAPRWHGLRDRLGRREWVALGWLSLLGNCLYYILLASAVQLGGIAMTSLVIGLLPVAVTILGSRDGGAPPLSQLAPSLLLGIAGVVCVGWQALGPAPGGSLVEQAAGLACAVGALVSWMIFAIGNTRWLARLDHVSAHDWSLLLGVVTGGQALLIVPAAVLLEATGQDISQWSHLIAVCAGVALLSSIAGNALWNRASRLLPLTLIGQMILFETLFALLYGFAWEARLPTMLETLAILLVIASVTSCFTAHKPAAAPA